VSPPYDVTRVCLSGLGVPVKTFPSSFKKKIRMSFIDATIRNEEEMRLGLRLVLEKDVVIQRRIFKTLSKSLWNPDDKVNNFSLISNMVGSFEGLNFI